MPIGGPHIKDYSILAFIWVPLFRERTIWLRQPLQELHTSILPGCGAAQLRVLQVGLRIRDCWAWELGTEREVSVFRGSRSPAFEIVRYLKSDPQQQAKLHVCTRRVSKGGTVTFQAFLSVLFRVLQLTSSSLIIIEGRSSCTANYSLGIQSFSRSFAEHVKSSTGIQGLEATVWENSMFRSTWSSARELQKQRSDSETTNAAWSHDPIMGCQRSRKTRATS